jgi:N-acetylglutamate synthase-like GNAT family acetyltransferase
MVDIRQAREQDCEQIRSIHCKINRPLREQYRVGEFLIAWAEESAIACAATAVHLEGGYFYGLAVKREWQRRGVGSELMEARLVALRRLEAEYAIALVMFWNSRFFRKHGFAPVKRSDLAPSAWGHADLTNPAFRRSAVMLRSLKRP